MQSLLDSPLAPTESPLEVEEYRAQLRDAVRRRQGATWEYLRQLAENPDFDPSWQDPEATTRETILCKAVLYLRANGFPVIPKPTLDKVPVVFQLGDRVQHSDPRVVDRRPINGKIYSPSATGRDRRQGTVVTTNPWDVCPGTVGVMWDDAADCVGGLEIQHPLKHLNSGFVSLQGQIDLIPTRLLEKL